MDEAGDAVDVLYDGKRMRAFRAQRIATENTHGTGCTYASAIAANMVRGFSLKESVARAKRYVTEAIRHAPAIGQGHGPVNHFYFLKKADVFPSAE